MPAQLPPTLRAILPALAADQGRARARTLLLIIGAGLNTVDQNIRGLDAALGTSSPGPAGLASLVSAARAASSASSPRIGRQHVISQVVLRRFCEPGAGGAGRQLIRHDVLIGIASPTGPRGAGYVQNFVKIDSKATEELWQQVENNMPKAIDAAINQTILSDPALISVLRDAIALHYVRNPQTLEVHEECFADALRNAVDALAGTPAAAEAFYRHHGLEPAGAQGRRLGAQELLAPMKDIFTQGTLFRLRVQDLFETVTDRFQSSGVEILVPSDADSEFLIGDTPALTVDFASGNAGVRAGISLGAANTIMLPLAPRLLIALGRTNAVAQVPSGFIHMINQVQAQAARQYVYCRPSATFGTRIAQWRTSGAPAITLPAASDASST